MNGLKNSGLSIKWKSCRFNRSGVKLLLNLYITGHGETEWNIHKRMQGWSDSSLTENGRTNAKALGNRLKEVDISKIYASPSGRTIATAKLIRGDRDTPILLDDHLKEIQWEHGKERLMTT